MLSKLFIPYNALYWAESGKLVPIGVYFRKEGFRKTAFANALKYKSVTRCEKRGDLPVVANILKTFVEFEKRAWIKPKFLTMIAALERVVERKEFVG